MRTKYTTTAPDGSAVTLYTHEGAGGPTSLTYQSHEKHLLAFPALLVGEKLLKLAETNSNQQISDKVSAARVTGEGPLLSGAAVASRIRGALKIRAKENGVTLQAAQDALATVRRANGIRVLKTGLKRTGKEEKSAAAVEGTSAKGESSDSELSELESEDEQ
jgi:hypothetical protein